MSSTDGPLRKVLHAHPDRWTVGLDQHLPPEEQARLRTALVDFSLQVLGGPSAPFPVEIEESEGAVEDSDEQRGALRRWRDRDALDLRERLSAAFDAVLAGALWDSPVFRAGSVEVRFHRGWRVIVDGSRSVETLAARHGLLVRDR